jgi:hypothetical protein
MPEPVEIDTLGAQLRAAIEQIAPGRGPTVWLPEHAVDENGQPVMNVNTAAELLRTTPRRGWLTPHRMKAIARAVRWPDSAIYIANAVELGLDPPPGGLFAASLPGWVDQLPNDVTTAARDVLMVGGRAYKLIK